MAGSIFDRPPKEMIFEWCKDGQHDKCRTQYGVGRIVCICDCDNHGTDYTPINKKMADNEINTSIKALNTIMVGDAGDGVSENRAVKSTSTIWGDQTKEGNKIGNYVNDPGKATVHYNPATVSKYQWKEALDAANIEELEQRREAGSKSASGFDDYSSFDQWL